MSRGAGDGGLAGAAAGALAGAADGSGIGPAGAAAVGAAGTTTDTWDTGGPPGAGVPRSAARVAPVSLEAFPSLVDVAVAVAVPAGFWAAWPSHSAIFSWLSRSFA